MAQIEHVLEIIYTILSCLASPLFWTETQLFSMLGLPTSTSFRMFPQTDIVPDYPAHIAHSCALIIILFIPHFISRERSASRAGRGALGRELSSDEGSQPTHTILGHVCPRLAGRGLDKLDAGSVHDRRQSLALFRQNRMCVLHLVMGPQSSETRSDHDHSQDDGYKLRGWLGTARDTRMVKDGYRNDQSRYSLSRVDPPDPAVEVGRRSGLICLLVRDVPDTCQDHTIIDQGPNIATQGMESC